MNALITFQFGNNDIRIQQDTNDQPWFNAHDVCQALDMGNPWQALKTHVDGDDIQKLEVIDNLGRSQKANFVNESGLYALIFGCTKEAAKAFKKWVTSEVLPSIRKTGAYSHKYAKPLSPVKQTIEAINLFTKLFGHLRQMELEHATAAVRANHTARNVSGIDLLELTGITQLVTEKAREEAAANEDHPLVEAFWEQFEYLDGKYLKNGDQIALNHSGDKTLIAINLVEYEAACSKAGLHLPCELAALKKLLKTSQQRKFVEMKPIRSAYNGRVVRCWLFQAGKARQTDAD